MVAKSSWCSIVSQQVELRKRLDCGFTAYFTDRELTTKELLEPSSRTEYGEEVQKKLDANELANKLGNVREVARKSGGSVKSIHNNRQLLEAHGPLALKRMYGLPLHNNRIDETTRNIVISLTLKLPYLTAIRISGEMMKRYKSQSVTPPSRTSGLRKSSTLEYYEKREPNI
ncbi:TPA: hypothetical protein RQJ98_000444 [Vibrio vulnificus]|uniref:hypothetical protein n=1 Tax=Vibrio parahaemolyticus TaxID=670 RepID=UPI0021533938|nr:hypothetical protein [Vibrio parahaemolyticus]HDY7681965.1 hypothetical protein [Vibrio vulnificus]